ncbi:hypothetical protein [Okeania sp. SIO1I7]|uniref:hypothetical protein n=1 Tax=Okeania sp. SIO1I7 TaxID=2607772 RepID=UPI0013F7AFF1|nr:hypothetical protein [Okeania sp. SIO1I7]NET29324.1 hypothetical protein [Okeania sp. SIO1I7]
MQFSLLPSTLYPTFRTTKCSNRRRRQETGDRILEENHSCRDQVHDQVSIYA